MKTTFLLLLSLLGILGKAQTKSHFETFKKNLKQKQISAENKKTRAIKQRLIKDSTFHNYQNQQTFDWSYSNDYTYSGERGSIQYMMQNEIYHDCYADTFNYASQAGAVIEKYRELAKYNANNQYTHYLELFYNDATLTYDSTYKADIYYNAQNLISEYRFWEYNGASWDDSYREILSYDMAGRLTQSIELAFNGISFDSTGRTENIYSGNNLVQSLYQSYDLGLNTWMNESKDSLIYNAQNLLTVKHRSSGWFGNMYNYFSKENTGYDANMRKDTSYNESWMLGGPVSFVHFKKYYYNGNDTFFNSVLNYDMQNVLESNYTYTFDANKNLIKAMQSSYSPFDTLIRYTDYYYEDYNVSTNIAAVEQIKGTTLFPNPAAQVTYLSFFTSTDEPLQLSVSDITGKVLINIQEQGFIGDHLIELPIVALNAGMYYVNIHNGIGSAKSMKLRVSSN